MKSKSKNTHNNYFERRGERTTYRIASAVAKKSWKLTAINLAWTAGPVTFIALQAGHFMGFGKQAPLENFIYFGGYTIIAGLLAVVASVMHDAFYKPRIEQLQKELLQVTNTIFLFSRSIRDAILHDLDPHERKIMAAYYILEGAGATPLAAGAAVMDLTNSTILRDATRRSIIFSEQGMYARVNDIWLSVQNELLACEAELIAVAPQAFERLKNWLQGDVPKLCDGVERTDGFIERILHASDKNNPDLMTLFDAFEVVLLAFELINGRRIAVLDARFNGDDAFELSQHALDEARHDYSLTLRRRNSKIRLLSEKLYNESSSSLIAETSDITPHLIDTMIKGLKHVPNHQRANFKSLYNDVTQLNKQLAVRHEKLVKAEADYARRWKRYGKKLTLAMQSKDLKKAGFYIEERYITLSDKEKIKCVQKLSSILEDYAKGITIEKIKQMAMDIALELDDFIDMSQPEEQIAIESSNTANFEFITVGLTPTTKAGWASLSIDSVHENRRKAAHKLAQNLTQFYRVPLTQEMQNLLVDEFGASKEYFEEMHDTLKQHPASERLHIPSSFQVLPKWDDIFTA